MDQFYIEEGYLEASYFTVIREAGAAFTVTASQTAVVDIADTTGYYIPDYIATDYFEAGGQVREADAAFTVTAAQTAVVERITQAQAAVSVSATNACTVTRIRDSTASFTAAFAPTLTATAFKNHTAVLDSVSTLSVDAQANRSANVLLEHIADLNAMAAKTVDVNSNLSHTVSAVITANTNSSAQVTATSTVTLACEALNLQFATAAFTASTKILAVTSRNQYGRPITIVDNVNFNDTFVKYGTHAASRTNFGPISTTANANIRVTNQFVYEGWHRRASLNSGMLMAIGATGVVGGNVDIIGDNQWILATRQRQLNNATLFSMRLLVKNNLNQTQIFDSQESSQVLVYAAWMPTVDYSHWAVTRDGSGVMQVFKNGTEIISGTVTTMGTASEYRGWWGNLDTNISSSRWDELSLRKKTSGITQAQQTDQPETQVFLFHLDNNLNDDTSNTINVTHSMTSALASTATLSAQANANTKQGAASLSTAVTVTASGGKIQSATVNLSSAFAQSTSADKFTGFVSTLNVTVTVTTVIGSIKSAESINLVAFDTAFSVTAQLAGVALLESSFAQSASAVKTTDVVSEQNTTAAITATLTGEIRAAADFGVTVTQSTDADRTRSTAAALASAFDHTVLDTLFKGHSADLAVTATVTVDVTKLKIAEATVNVTATTAISAQKTTDVISTQSLSTAISTDNLRVRFADSTQVTQVTVTADAVLTSDPVMAFSVQTTQITNAVKTADSDIIAVSLFTPSFDVDFITRPQVFFETQSTLSVIIGSIKQFEPSVNTGLHLPLESPYQDSDATIYPNSIQEQGYLLGSVSVPQGYAYNAGTISFWLRRDTSESDAVSLISRIENTNASIVQLDGTTLRVFDQGYAGLYGISWTSAFPADTQWHHVFLRYRDNLGGFYGDGYELWIDGVSQGGREFQSVSAGIITFVAEYGVRLQNNGGGSVAQLRIGNGSNNDITVSDVYDQGYRNLGPDGRGGFNQFTTPGIYAELNQPWSNIIAEQSDYEPLSYRGSAEPIPVPTLQAYANLNARFIGVFLYAIQMQSQTDLTGNATIIRDTIVDLNNSFALAIATGGGLFGGVSDLAVENTQSCTITKTTGYTANLSSTATLFARGGYEQEIAADLTVSAEVLCDFDNLPPTRGEAQLSSAFTLTADANSFTDTVILVASLGTLTADVTVIPPIRVEADLSVTVSMSVTIGSIEQFASLTMSTGIMTVTAVKTTGIVQSMASSFNLAAGANKFHGIILTLTAFNTQLTVGDVINLDPALTLRVRPESRLIKITQETRVRRILPETRVNIIED